MKQSLGKLEIAVETETVVECTSSVVVVVVVVAAAAAAAAAVVVVVCNTGYCQKD